MPPYSSGNGRPNSPISPHLRGRCRRGTPVCVVVRRRWRRDHLAGELLDGLAQRLVLVVEPKIHAAHGRIRLARVTAPGIGARVTGVYRTFQHLIHEVAKFGIVGPSTTSSTSACSTCS